MGRPESPITWDGPVAELARALRELRERAGRPTYRKMAGRPGCFSRHSLLAAAAAGRSCPTWEVLRDYVTACGERPEDWREQWERARKAPHRRAASRRTATPSTRPAARTQPPEPPTASDPSRASSAREYVMALRELRAWSGQRSHYEIDAYYRAGGAAASTRLAKSTLYDALNPNREHLPPLEIVRAVVAACHADLEIWTQAWRHLRMQEHHQSPLPIRPVLKPRNQLPPGRNSRPADGYTWFTPRDAERLTQLRTIGRQVSIDDTLDEFHHMLATTSYPDPTMSNPGMTFADAATEAG